MFQADGDCFVGITWRSPASQSSQHSQYLHEPLLYMLLQVSHMCFKWRMAVFSPYCDCSTKTSLKENKHQMVRIGFVTFTYDICRPVVSCIWMIAWVPGHVGRDLPPLNHSLFPVWSKWFAFSLLLSRLHLSCLLSTPWWITHTSWMLRRPLYL